MLPDGQIRDSLPLTNANPRGHENLSWRVIVAISATVGLVYFFSNPKPANHYDYTFRVAENMLHGSIAFAEKPPSWLNEFVQFDGVYYSVFPLGAVLSMFPFAVIKAYGYVSEMPAGLIAALLAAAACLILLAISRHYRVNNTRRIVMALAILFGTFTWTNLTFAGAWQLALGFALVGELGAIYFTAFDKRPLLAGLFFALAFGNRTEILLLAPILVFFLIRRSRRTDDERDEEPSDGTYASMFRLAPGSLRSIVLFCAVPFALGIATLGYNYIRFDSPADFGYARIPGVLDEPWYVHGIFSPYYIPRQIWEMFFKLWEFRPHFPLPLPNPFSSSILISSPFLVLAFRFGAKDKVLKYLCWLGVLLLCTVLWMHGNSGGWQFSYRYAMIILPLIFVILLESSPKKIAVPEMILFAFSLAANAYATWLFHWTENIRV